MSAAGEATPASTANVVGSRCRAAMRAGPPADPLGARQRAGLPPPTPTASEVHPAVARHRQAEIDRPGEFQQRFRC